MIKASQGTTTSNNTTIERYKTMNEAVLEINPLLKKVCFAKEKLILEYKSNYIFELDKIEEENLAKYLNKLKKKYGSYGFLTYEFTPTGIGTVIKVRSSHKKKAKEITNLSSW